jgi:hypothetical protein
VAWRDFDPTAAWAEFVASSSRASLEVLLGRHVVESEDGHLARTPLCLPAMCRVARNPDSALIVPVATFRSDFAAGPDGTPEWRALVLRQADAALAACAAAP